MRLFGIRFFDRPEDGQVATWSEEAGHFVAADPGQSGTSGGLTPGEPVTQIVGDDGGVAYESPDNIPIFAFREEGKPHDQLQVWVDGSINMGDGSTVPALQILPATSEPSGEQILTIGGGFARATFHPDSGVIDMSGALLAPFEEAATTPGTVIGRVGVWDPTGVLIGYMPVYDAIT